MVLKARSDEAVAQARWIQDIFDEEEPQVLARHLQDLPVADQLVVLLALDVDEVNQLLLCMSTDSVITCLRQCEYAVQAELLRAMDEILRTSYLSHLAAHHPAERLALGIELNERMTAAERKAAWFHRKHQTAQL